MLNAKINNPATEGTNGQVLITDGNGGRSWATVSGGGADLTLVHTALTVSSNVLTFTPANARVYGRASISANLSLVLNLGTNVNEHYILLSNSSLSAVTVAISGSSSETIIGKTAISIPASTECELSVIKDNEVYVITYFIL